VSGLPIPKQGASNVLGGAGAIIVLVGAQQLGIDIPATSGASQPTITTDVAERNAAPGLVRAGYFESGNRVSGLRRLVEPPKGPREMAFTLLILTIP
jgi:hypothetical protein